VIRGVRVRGKRERERRGEMEGWREREGGERGRGMKSQGKKERVRERDGEGRVQRKQ